MGFFSSISPKAHGAYLGAGTAAAISNVIIQLIWPHSPVPAGYTQLVYAGVGVILAGFGAWVMPSGKTPAVVQLPPVPENLHPNVVITGGGGASAHGPQPGSARGGPGGGMSVVKDVR